MPSATARLSSTTGDGATAASARRARRSGPSRCPRPCAPARGRRRSPPAARTAPERRAPRRARSAARPRRISRRSQRARSWSSSSTGVPVAARPARAIREAWISISASRPQTSASRGASVGQHAAQAQRVLAQRRPHPVVAGGRRVALVEDQVDDLEHRRQARRAARRRAAPRTAPASASVRLARTIRCATVASGTRNARAISGVVSPPSSRSVSATRASVESTGWQQVKISRSRSSPIVVGARRRGAARPAIEEADLRVLALQALRPADEVDRAVLGGGHQPGARVVRDARLAATARARRRARPARGPRRGRRRASSAPARRSGAADSMRQTASIARCVAARSVTPRSAPAAPAESWAASWMSSGKSDIS